MQPQAIAIFDFDGTMIKGDSIIAFIRYAMTKGKLSVLDALPQLMNALKGITGRISPEAGKSRALRFLGRMQEEEQHAFCRAFCLDKLVPRLYPAAMARMKEHADQGHRVLLVSASPSIYMQHLVQWLPVEAVLATPTDTGGTVTHNTRGEEKVRRVQSWAERQPFPIDWHNSWAYGNSASDLPVMRLTGYPVLVNPSKDMLKDGQGLPVERWRD